MDIRVESECTDELVEELLVVWEASVRATHDFLTEADIQRIGTYVPGAFRAVPLLMTARDGDGSVLGFAGLDGEAVEMLFIAPTARGCGVGKALLREAVETHGARRLDVNEQNGQARGFYEHCGFVVVGRSETDNQGDPFPLLHMELVDDGATLAERTLPIERVAGAPELVPAAAAWFADKWDVPAAAYAESMEESVARKDAVPQWLVVRDREAADAPIVAGCGIIENDFHDRPDLAPNLCALYVEEPCRGRGLARRLLEAARVEAARLGRDRLYLITDHDSFYERCGWEHLGFAHEEDGTEVRLYGIDAAEA